jgi:hypothetical protein
VISAQRTESDGASADARFELARARTAEDDAKTRAWLDRACRDDLAAGPVWRGYVGNRLGKLFLYVKHRGAWTSYMTRYVPGQESEAMALLRRLRIDPKEMDRLIAERNRKRGKR